MSDVIEKLRFVRKMGTRVILDQEDVIELMAIIEGNPREVTSKDESEPKPLLFYPPITMK